MEPMTGTKTYYGSYPDSYRRWWLEHVYPQRVSRLAGCLDDDGGILDQPMTANNSEQIRLKRFGPCWSWWGVPENERQQWWERG
ncbi:hypothetical protein [Cyanobium sp. WAJ14-Wanaka]|uniref:hypothetical protein n=1 Tax=Cyanobium sp. WAJ14-Wanaka TaxID=2823725 RepID=UPI0020CD5492|nr:hypothetical protein [Cyanobium sp. WAJ14-Wanaka]MCP9776208.1 hypothetical protein [Cyanobium sp. WAJ14-Wanaka]